MAGTQAEHPTENGSSPVDLAQAYRDALRRQGVASPESAAESFSQLSGALPHELALSEMTEPAKELPLLTVLEGLLFVGDPASPALAPERLAQVLGLAGPGEVFTLVKKLNERYEREGRPYRVFSQTGGFVLRLLEDYRPVVNRLRRRVREGRLSQAALEVLAIVAYRQPITTEEVSRLRGRPSAHLLLQLVQKGLLQAASPPGRSRPIHFSTTPLFEEVFGLENLDDLPQIKKGGESKTDGSSDEIQPPESAPR